MSKVCTSTPIETPPKRIVSGLQPSGALHLGNYLGAIKNWLSLQNQGECFFFIADLHSLTEVVEASVRKKAIEDMLLMVVAAGVNPEEARVFRQSSVSYHTELAWALMCTARTGWLNRMVQYRDKSDEGETSVSAGLYTYPVLQAADILLYGATHVPVGDDQFQHLQLTRDIAQSFNSAYGETFVLPQPVMTGPATRVMSLKDPTRKMSKSDDDDMTRINLLDSDDLISKKIKRAVSETELLPDSAEALEGRPAARNLINMYAALRDTSPSNILESEMAGKGFGPLKNALTEAVIATIAPIRYRFAEMQTDREEHLRDIQYGADEALFAAEVKMVEVRQKLAID